MNKIFITAGVPHKTISHSLTTITNNLIAVLGSTLQLRLVLILLGSYQVIETQSNQIHPYLQNQTARPKYCHTRLQLVF